MLATRDFPYSVVATSAKMSMIPVAEAQQTRAIKRQAVFISFDLV